MYESLMVFLLEHEQELVAHCESRLSHVFADRTTEWVNWLQDSFCLILQGNTMSSCKFTDEGFPPAKSIFILDETALAFRNFVFEKSENRSNFGDWSVLIDQAFITMRQLCLTTMNTEVFPTLYSDIQFVKEINGITQAMLQKHTENGIFHVISDGLKKFGVNIAVFKLADTPDKAQLHFSSYSQDVKNYLTGLTGRDPHGVYSFEIPPDSRLSQVIKNKDTQAFFPNDELLACLIKNKQPILIETFKKMIGSPKTILASGVVNEQLKAILAVSGDHLTEKEIPIISIFANQLAIAMQNASLYQEADRRSEQLAGLNALAKMTASERTIEDVLRQANPIIKNLLTFDKLSLSLKHEEDLFVYTTGQKIEQKILNLISLQDTEAFENALQTNQMLIVDDLIEKPHPFFHQLTAPGVQSVMICPMSSNDQVWGTINVGRTGPNSFTKSDQHSLVLIVDQLAPLIENALLYRRIEERELKYRTLFELSGDAIFILDRDSIIRDVNSAAKQILGYPLDHVINQPFLSFFPEEDEEEFLLIGSQLMFLDIEGLHARFKIANGSLIDIEMNTRRLDFEDNALQVIVRDITEKKKIEQELKYMGTHDLLTGLFNRNYFEIEMQRYNHSRMYPISMIIIDVDGLKQANDLRGHAAGDLLLKQTAKVLKSVFRSEDIVARWGGDEFAVLLPLVNEKTCTLIMNRICHELRLYNEALDQEQPKLSFSIGMATAQQNEELGEIMKAADKMMYKEKALKRKQKSIDGHQPVKIV